MTEKALIRGIRKMIVDKIEEAIVGLVVRMQVTDIYYDNGKVYIKANSVNDGTTDEKIKLLSHGLGNGRGIISYPKIGDFGLVLNILGERFYIGSMFDEYTKYPDKQILDKDSTYIINNDFASYICIHKNNDIIIKTKEGGKIKLGNDGVVKVFNKDNYGLDVDENGVVKIRGSNASGSSSSAYETSTPGTFP